MRKSPFTTFLIRAAIVFAFTLSGRLAWFTAFWLVDYEIAHGVGVRFIVSVAYRITEVGEILMLLVGAVFGIVVAIWITRRRVSHEDGHINPTS